MQLKEPLIQMSLSTATDHPGVAEAKQIHPSELSRDIRSGQIV